MDTRISRFAPHEPLLYRAAREGVYGSYIAYARGAVADALFVFLDGEPDAQAEKALDAAYRARPLVCLTDAWEAYVKARYPEAAVYTRWRMKPAKRFALPAPAPLPEGYRVGLMDEAAFSLHPFSHGVNYPGYAAFRETGSGAAAYFGEEIAAAASSFLSLDGEVELDLSTKEAHRGRGLACACAARMLRDCMEKGFTVHWDAQNEISRHLAHKLGFEEDGAYSVYYLPARDA